MIKFAVIKYSVGSDASIQMKQGLPIPSGTDMIHPDALLLLETSARMIHLWLRQMFLYGCPKIYGSLNSL